MELAIIAPSETGGVQLRRHCTWVASYAPLQS